MDQMCHPASVAAGVNEKAQHTRQYVRISKNSQLKVAAFARLSSARLRSLGA